MFIHMDAQKIDLIGKKMHETMEKIMEVIKEYPDVVEVSSIKDTNKLHKHVVENVYINRIRVVLSQIVSILSILNYLHELNFYRLLPKIDMNDDESYDFIKVGSPLTIQLLVSLNTFLEMMNDLGISTVDSINQNLSHAQTIGQQDNHWRVKSLERIQNNINIYYEVLADLQDVFVSLKDLATYVEETAPTLLTEPESPNPLCINYMYETYETKEKMN